MFSFSKCADRFTCIHCTKNSHNWGLMFTSVDIMACLMYCTSFEHAGKIRTLNSCHWFLIFSKLKQESEQSHIERKSKLSRKFFSVNRLMAITTALASSDVLSGLACKLFPPFPVFLSSPQNFYFPNFLYFACAFQLPLLRALCCKS